MIQGIPAWSQCTAAELMSFTEEELDMRARLDRMWGRFCEVDDLLLAMEATNSKRLPLVRELRSLWSAMNDLWPNFSETVE